MLRKPCREGIHSRDRRRIVKYGETWRSNCVKCGARLERVKPGDWRVVSGDEKLPFKRYVASAELQPPPDPSSAASNRNEAPSVAPQEYDFASAAGRRIYYAARADEARALAAQAADRSIELIHLEMALRYDLLARDDVPDSAPLRMVR